MLGYRQRLVFCEFPSFSVQTGKWGAETGSQLTACTATSCSARFRISAEGRSKRETGLRRSAIYQGMAEGTFRRQVRLGPKAVGWLEHEIDAWIEDRIAERDGEVA